MNKGKFLVLAREHPDTHEIEYCIYGGVGNWSKNINRAKEYCNVSSLKTIAKKSNDWHQRSKKYSPAYYPDKPYIYRIVPAQKEVILDWTQEQII